MRFLFTLSVSLVVLATVFLDSPLLIYGAVAALKGTVQGAAYDKRVEFIGLTYLTESELTDLLPNDRSVLWWRMNTSSLEARLRQHALVEKAQVTQCAEWDWACFSVTITERRGQMAAKIGSRMWVLGSDAGFIAPLPSKWKQAEGPRDIFTMFGLPLIEGIDSGNASPHAVQARFRYLIKRVAEIERSSGKRAVHVQLRKDGDLELVFKELPFPVVFGFDEADGPELKKQVQRLKALLTELSGREGSVASVDLAFEKLAVVKTVENKRK